MGMLMTANFFFNAYHEIVNMLSTFKTSRLNFTTTLCISYYFCPFENEQTKVLKGPDFV